MPHFLVKALLAGAVVGKQNTPDRPGEDKDPSGCNESSTGFHFCQGRECRAGDENCYEHLNATTDIAGVCVAPMKKCSDYKFKTCCVVLKTGECFDGFFCNLSPDTCNMCASTTHWDKQKKQGDRCEDPLNTKMGDTHCQTDSSACQKCGIASPVALWETPKPKEPNCCVSFKTGQCMAKKECNVSKNNCDSCSSTTHWIKVTKEDKKKCLDEDDNPMTDDNCQKSKQNCQTCGLMWPRGMWSTPPPNTPVKPTPTPSTTPTTPSPLPSKEEQIVLV